MTISKILKLSVFVVMAACASEEDPIDRLSRQVCSCQEVAEGKLSPSERTQCEEAAAVVLTKAPASCVSCLDRVIGEAASKSTCASATACGCDNEGEVDDDLAPVSDERTPGF
jgi:hypothetical protein